MAERKRTPAPKPLDPPSRWRLDLAAALLLIAGLLTAVSIFSHDPTGTSSNLFGEQGTRFARGLLSSLGVATHVLLASWFVLVVVLFLREGLLAWTRRLVGWLLLVPLVAVLAERFAVQIGEGWTGWTPPRGPGGSIGAWLSLLLAQSLQPVTEAAVLIFGTLFVMLLIADHSILRLLRGSWRGLRWLLILGGPREGIEPSSSRAVPPVRQIEPEVPEDEPNAVVPISPSRAIPIRHHERLEKPPVVVSFDDFELPNVTLLDEPEAVVQNGQDKLLRERATLLEKTFNDFGLKVQVVGINTGPVITQYELALDTGLRVSKVTRLADDLALNLRVPNVRIVAPIPGKNTVGVEVPNEERARVRLKEVLLAGAKRASTMKVPLFLGKDAEGRPMVHDLADMPHLLIAGSTGTGKSVCMNAIILSMLMMRRPDEVKFIMIDPKQGVEMGGYSKLPHMMHPVIEDMKKAEAILAWAVDKMDERYDLLRQTRVRNIAGYNQLTPEEIHRRCAPADEDEKARIPTKMPYIVIIIDELADLMLQFKKEVEGHIIRLAQKSRAAGIHLVLATQKPTVDVITGLIKSNLPARVCFKVVNKTDSRVVLDAMGADKLLGKGDMLFLPPGTSDLVRAQCTYAGDQEINRVVEVLESDEPCYAEELMHLPTNVNPGELLQSMREKDELYEEAVEIVVREQRGSVSLLQRALGIGYGRAARLIDFMAEGGIVGGYKGSNAREVLYTPEQWEEMKARV